MHDVMTKQQNSPVIEYFYIIRMAYHLDQVHRNGENCMKGFCIQCMCMCMHPHMLVHMHAHCCLSLCVHVHRQMEKLCIFFISVVGNVKFHMI